MKKYITNKIVSIGLKYKNVINRSPVLESIGKRIYYRLAFGIKSVSKPSTFNKYTVNSEYSMLSNSANKIFEILKEGMKNKKVNNSLKKYLHLV